jgi:hypothetical protein
MVDAPGSCGCRRVPRRQLGGIEFTEERSKYDRSARAHDNAINPDHDIARWPNNRSTHDRSHDRTTIAPFIITTDNDYGDAYNIVFGVSSRRHEQFSLSGVPGPRNSGLYRYKPQTNVWTTLASMSVARGGLAAVYLNRKVYALGGLLKTNLEPIKRGSRGGW